MHSEDPKNSPNYGRIINDRHFKRLSEALKFHKETSVGKIVGGQQDAAQLYLSPTIIDFDELGPGSQTPVMASEIFGPILPVLPVQNVDEAINFVNSRSVVLFIKLKLLLIVS